MKPRFSAQGSVLVLVLLLIAVSGVIIAGWISVISARSGMVEQMTAASKRRIAYENSRALAQEFMLERVVPSTSGTAFSYSLADSWGSISVPAWNSAPLVSVQKAAGYNHFNPGNGDGYTLELPVTLFNGDDNPARRFHVKSRSPLLAGNLLTAQAPPTSSITLAIGALAVQGAAFVWTPNLSMNFTASAYAAPEGTSESVTFRNSAGNTLLMNNLALPLQTANPRSLGSYYTGQFDTIDNNNAAANSSAAKVVGGGGTTVLGSTAMSANGITCDGEGHVTIVLNTPSLGSVYIPGDISTLTLTGQATANEATADDLPAILIVVNQPPGSTRDLTSVTLAQHNSRRLNLAIKKTTSTGNLPISFSTGSAQWRLVLECENTPIALTAPGTVRMQGGIRSDRSIALSSGALQLLWETDPKFLDRLATRTAWVESFAP